jgi:parvulin-like peptidyl-prolyl isomerase
MEPSTAFLTVDDQALSLRDALKYLQSSGKLQGFIADILRQYILEAEVKNRDDLDIDPGMVQQSVIDFRLQQNLSDPQAFQEFLVKNGSDATTFNNQIMANFKVEKLKAVVAEPKLQEYFIERKVFLDRMILSRIIVAEKELADELKLQIQEGESFEKLAQQHSLTDDKLVNGMMGPVSRGTLPDEIRAKLDAAQAGELVGPLELENRWGLFRIDQHLPASLDDAQLQQTLRNELYERWLTEKLQKLTVKLQVT